MTINLALFPRDGFSIKDGRSFHVAGGSRARGVGWPLPSTMAGAVRTSIGLAMPDAPTRRGDPRGPAFWGALRQTSVAGPLPMRRAVGRAVANPAWEALYPAPHDAVLVPDRRDRRATAAFLSPRKFDEDGAGLRGCFHGGASSAEARATDGLWRPALDDRAKPWARRLFWTSESFLDWLVAPGGQEFGPDRMEPATRTDVHVAIQSDRSTAQESALFMHDTHELLSRASGFDGWNELAIAVRIDAADPDRVRAAIASDCWRLGGESRLARVSALDALPHGFPTVRFRRHKEVRRFRLILVTPAAFEHGWRPDWLSVAGAREAPCFEGRLPGLERRVILRSAILDRGVMTSGWDALIGAPKATRRLAPAGAVYFFELATGEPSLTPEDVASLWLRSLHPTGSQDALDGYGLAVPALWPEPR